MQTSMTPAEKELHRAKEALSFLNQITSQAERGAAIDFDKALQTVSATSANLQLLAQGQIPLSSDLPPSQSDGGSHVGSSNTGGFVVGGAAANVHARAAATMYNVGGVTELQRRRAQQVLSELQLIETTLRRYQKKRQQAAGHASNVQELLGKYGSKQGGADRNDYSELEQLHKEQESLQYSRRRMQQMDGESRAVLQALQGQTGRLGGTGDKLASVMESIGASSTTLLQIVRRNQVDAWLVYGGIIAFLFLMWYIW